MIDFSNKVLFKLKPVDNRSFWNMIAPLFLPGETLLASFQALRDGVVFTNKRIITINVQGITGAKKDFTTLPYSKIQAFSVETAGILDNDSELDLWFANLGRVRLEFTRGTDVAGICRTISEFTLQSA